MLRRMALGLRTDHHGEEHEGRFWGKTWNLLFDMLNLKRLLDICVSSLGLLSDPPSWGHSQWPGMTRRMRVPTSHCNTASRGSHPEA